MPNEVSTLIARIRAGDGRATEELVRLYGPAIRLEVRRRMRDARFRRVFDSVDICQSVLASFFIRVSLGQYDLGDPNDLVALLMGMARNKLAFEIRKHQRQCRDNRRVESLGEQALESAAPGPSPSQVVAGEELLAAVRRSLTPEERDLADRRANGQSWAEIAAAVGGSEHSVRKQLERVVERITRRFGLEEADHE